MAANTLTMERTMTTSNASVNGNGSTEAVVVIEGLNVNYGAVQAVRNVSFSIKQGEIFGILGPNGAGKSTTLSAMEGIVKPSSGRISVLGFDVLKQPNEVKQRLGISLQSTAFFDNMKVWELIRLYAGLYEVNLSKADVMELLARFDLTEKANVNADQLSGGQRQRVALTLAVANNPQIVVLDEPTTGLDPQARRAVWEIIRSLRAEGRTVLLTTHYMEEASELCSRIGIIDRGELIALDTPGALINSLKADSIVSVTLQLPEEDVLSLPGVTGVRHDGERLLISTNNAHETTMGLQKLAVERGQLLTDLSIKQPDLEDVFIALTGRNIA